MGWANATAAKRPKAKGTAILAATTAPIAALTPNIPAAIIPGVKENNSSSGSQT